MKSEDGYEKRMMDNNAGCDTNSRERSNFSLSVILIEAQTLH
jgi:hypothetical protein